MIQGLGNKLISPGDFVFSADENEVFRIKPDGKVVLNAPPDEAAKVFWEAVEGIRNAKYSYNDITCLPIRTLKSYEVEVLKAAKEWYDSKGEEESYLMDSVEDLIDAMKCQEEGEVK